MADRAFHDLALHLQVARMREADRPAVAFHADLVGIVRGRQGIVTDLLAREHVVVAADALQVLELNYPDHKITRKAKKLPLAPAT